MKTHIKCRPHLFSCHVIMVKTQKLCTCTSAAMALSGPVLVMSWCWGLSRTVESQGPWPPSISISIRQYLFLALYSTRLINKPRPWTPHKQAQSKLSHVPVILTFLLLYNFLHFVWVTHQNTDVESLLLWKILRDSENAVQSGHY